MKLVKYKVKNNNYSITSQTKLISNFILAGCLIDFTKQYIGNKEKLQKRELLQDRYIVTGGDTLEDISKDFDLSVDQIKYVNKIKDIYPGLVLLIPKKEQLKLIYSIPNKPILDEIPGEQEEICKPKEKMLALTFDDGPGEYTNKILDLLYQYDCNATFYIQGKKVKEYSDLIKKIVRNGNQLGNHGYTHTEFTDMSLYDIRNEIFATNQQLFKIGVDYPSTIRPPHGMINEEIKCNMDYPCILWNVDSRDWEKRNTRSIKNNILNKVTDGSIILMHDLYKETYEALCYIIPELKRRGYKLVTVDELYKYHNIKLEKGKIYRMIIK